MHGSNRARRTRARRRVHRPTRVPHRQRPQHTATGGPPQGSSRGGLEKLLYVFGVPRVRIPVAVLTKPPHSRGFLHELHVDGPVDGPVALGLFLEFGGSRQGRACAWWLQAVADGLAVGTGFGLPTGMELQSTRQPVEALATLGAGSGAGYAPVVRGGRGSQAGGAPHARGWLVGAGGPQARQNDDPRARRAGGRRPCPAPVPPGRAKPPEAEVTGSSPVSPTRRNSWKQAVSPQAGTGDSRA